MSGKKEESTEDRVQKLKRKLNKATESGNTEKMEKLKAKLEKAEAALGGSKRKQGKSEESEGQAHKKKKRKLAEQEQAQSEVSKEEKPSADEDVKPDAPTERPKPTGNTSIVLFYAYVKPPWTKSQQDDAIAFAKQTLTKNGCTGRLRVAREGFNATLTGPHFGLRRFCEALREYQPEHFGNVDFKFVDHLPESQMLKDLKVFPVSELVTYGFSTAQADIDSTGNHLPAEDFHASMEDPNAIMIDVRNFNETAIGKFQPPDVEVLDPCMRKSTEFPKWVDDNMQKLQGRKILMYCTGGIRCERASAYLVEKGLEDVNQLQGGIHKYLETYNDDGGFWVGKNYTFDRRFAHGAKKCDVISHCVVCDEKWERYQAHMKCPKCKMEVLVCKTCQMNQKKLKQKIPKTKLLCELCRPRKRAEKAPQGQKKKFD